MGERRVPDPGFAGDAGDADPELAAALERYATDPAAEAEVLAALAAARLLVPVVAVLTEEAPAALDQGELRREKSSDMALATLVGTDGRRALPVFTSLETLARWDPQARPVPVEARRAALAARAEGTAVAVVDVAGPVPYVVPEPALRALAEGAALRPAYEDPAVAAAVASVLAGEPAVRAAHLLPAPGVDARLGLVLCEGLPPAEVAALAQRLAAALRAAPALRAAVVRGLDLALLPPDTTDIAVDAVRGRRPVYPA